MVALLAVPMAHAQVATDDIETDKLAQTGFKFLSVSVDARSAAMADAMTADPMASSVAMFYNPAGMAWFEGNVHVGAGQTQWIADINYNIASVAFRPAGGVYGVFGLSLVSVDYGSDIIGTVRANNENGFERYEDLGLANPEPTALAIGLGYAKALSDRFSVGGNVKYARQDLGSGVVARGDGSGLIEESNDKNTIAFDFGVLYKTGFRSLNFAMSARNFSRELQYVQENFELPLTFRIGVSMDLMDFTNMNRDMHALRVVLDAERPRDFSEQLKVGGEYLFMNTLALRAGYTFPTDEQGVSLGVGLQQQFGDYGIGADYAYTTFGDYFDSVNRFAIQFSF